MKNLKTFEEYNPTELGMDDYADSWDQAYDNYEDEDETEHIELEPIDPSEYEEGEYDDEPLPF